MCSELECGICYQSYNAGLRCPRELRCHHSFCESCLVALSQPQARLESGRRITCPLCRHVTFISGEKMRAALRVDECVFERMVAAGVLEDGAADDDVGDENVGNTANDEEEEESEEALPGESDSSPGSRGGRVRRSLKTVWGKITGHPHSARRRNCQTDCMTSDDFRDFTMMTCYMF